MFQKITSSMRVDKSKFIIPIAATIALLQFAYSFLADADLAIATLIDVLIGCGILASVFWGWHLASKKDLSLEPSMIVSSAMVTLPLLPYQRNLQFLDFIFCGVAILAPILCHMAIIFSAKCGLTLKHWIGALSIVIAMLLSAALIMATLYAIGDAPIFIIFWIIEIVAIRNKNKLQRQLIYILWIATLWASGLLCYTGISFYWATYIRRYLFPLSMFLWPFIFWMFLQLIRSYFYFGIKKSHVALKTAIISLTALAVLFGLHLLFCEFLTEKYRITHLLYFLLLSDVIIFRETCHDGAVGPIDKLIIGCGVILVNLGSICFYLYQKILLLSRFTTSSPNDIPNISYWFDYRLTAIKSFLANNYDALEQNFPREFGRYAQSILDENRLVSMAHYWGFLPVIVILLLSVILFRLFLRCDCKKAWIKHCVQYASLGFILRTLLAALSDITLLKYDRISFPFSGYGAVELFFLIVVIKVYTPKSAEPVSADDKMQENAEEKM